MNDKTDVIEMIENLTPREIVDELSRYIIGQNDAKRAVSIALRNRWRRLRVEGDMREEITPKNIILIGPTGVGKTEIARRLAKLANAPFFKVEASKFTEVGYVGKDVESMVRDLVEVGINMVRRAENELVKEKAKSQAEERLLDLLLPKKEKKNPGFAFNLSGDVSESETKGDENQSQEKDSDEKTRDKLRQMFRDGKLDERKVEIDVIPPKPGIGSPGMPMVEIISAGGSLDDLSSNLRDMLGGLMPKDNKKRSMTVPEAFEILIQDEAAKLIDMDAVTMKALKLVENNGIIFIDEIDKIASRQESGRSGGDVSREGVQRDILPIVEGSTVSTKYGFVKTDHILFVASGAFHLAKPSDLIPELQGRFPIRVELNPLKQEDFLRILTEPQNSLLKQYQALMKTEGIDLNFDETAVKEISAFAALANDQMENIGARRLHTIMEKVMDELSFDANERTEKSFTVDGAYVKNCLASVIENQDLSQYIL